jgi:hypothetical protein
MSEQVLIALIGAASTLIVAVVSHFGRKLGKAVEGTHSRIDRLEERIDELVDKFEGVSVRLDEKVFYLADRQSAQGERIARLERAAEQP